MAFGRMLASTAVCRVLHPSRLALTGADGAQRLVAGVVEPSMLRTEFDHIHMTFLPSMRKYVYVHVLDIRTNVRRSGASIEVGFSTIMSCHKRWRRWIPQDKTRSLPVHLLQVSNMLSTTYDGYYYGYLYRGLRG